MDGQRLGARPGPDPAAHHLTPQPQRGRRAAGVARPGALGGQGPGGHPDRGQPKDGPKVHGQAGTAGMVASGGVDHQHLGGDRQGAHGPLEQRPFSEGEQGWQVRPTGGPADARPGQQAAAVGYRRPGEPRVTRGTSPLGPHEADEAGANPLQGRWGLPAPWGHVPEGLL
jgi:hypothetical protein